MKRTITLTMLVLCIWASGYIQAQDTASPAGFARLEEAISTKKNFQQVLQQLQIWQQHAVAAGDQAMVARCLYDRLQIVDRITEDTLYFKNALFIDSVLQSQAPAQLKLVMHVIKARRIDQYKRLFIGQSRKNLISSYDTAIDYSRLSRAQLDSLSLLHLQKAREIARAFPDASGEGLLWLSSDPFTFLFRPVLADMVYAEQVSFCRAVTDRLYANRRSGWLLLSQEALLHLSDTAYAFSAAERKLLSTYQQWGAFHLAREEKEAAYYIETLARKFLYQNGNADSGDIHRYGQYLQQLVASPYSAVKVHGVYQLCLLWSGMGLWYNPLAMAEGGIGVLQASRRTFDTTYRYHYAKAAGLYQASIPLLDSFPFIKRALQQLYTRICLPELSLTVNRQALPGRPLLVGLRYRNTPQLHMRLVRVSALYERPDKRPQEWEVLFSTPVVWDTLYQLPLTMDYQYHSTFLKLNGLPAGRYALLYADSAVAKYSDRTQWLYITITGIGMMYNGDRLFVLDRITGFPLTGAVVAVQGHTWKVQAKGYISVPGKDNESVVIYYGKDSVTEWLSSDKESLPDDVYDKEDYDSRLEYYEDHTELQMYTDRAIYRPGQTVYYKGIFMTKDMATGTPVVLNWQHLKLPFFTKLLARLIVKWGHHKIPVLITDPFNKAMDTLYVLPNSYGSFAGSFVIPKTAATGEWKFEVSDDNIDIETAYESSHFQVEEYKRPSFTLALEKPVRSLQLQDTFSIKAVAKTFAGAPLGNVQLGYTIHRSGYLPGEGYRDVEVAVGKAVTSSQGEWWIPVRDSGLLQYTLPDSVAWSAGYEINVEAVDATGESMEEKLTVSLSTRPVHLSIQIESRLDRSHIPDAYIGAKDDFAGAVQKNITVRLYRKREYPPAKRADQDWLMAVDAPLYTRQQLEEWFPDVIFQSEAVQQGTDKELVYTTEWQAGGKQHFSFPQSLLPAGQYQIEFTCIEQGRITGRDSRDFSVFDKAAGAFAGDAVDFNYLVHNYMTAGDAIHWLTGHKEANAVFAIYSLSWYQKTGKTIRRHYAYSTAYEPKGIHSFTYTTPHAVYQLMLTHTYLSGNRWHTVDAPVYVQDDAVAPDIVVEQYRKKLTPGSKETFVVSVKTKQANTAAELMTTLYDASLDKLEEHAWRAENHGVRFQLRNNWSYGIAGTTYTGLTAPGLLMLYTPESDLKKPLWWMTTGAYDAGRFDLQQAGNMQSMSYALQGRLAGLDASYSNGFQDVVVVGYGAKRSAASAVSVIRLRGAASLSSAAAGLLVILDGAIYTRDISTVDVSQITDIAVLKGTDGTALYGSRAAGGVLVLSTKGPVQLPVAAPEPAAAPVIRKNFSETAFFYPQMYADRDGYFRISFTLPESVTAWNWKLLAHTKKGVFAYAARKLVSQLPLMVQPAMPRFLYEGDRMVLKSRIVNMDSNQLSGSLRCVIEDAATGADLTAQLVATATQSFVVAGSSNTSGTFTIQVPAGLLHPLRVRISAGAGVYSDGEEHLIPVLSRKILVTAQVPVRADAIAPQEVHPPQLPADAIAYGTALYITPRPQAGILYALPYLANYPYGCAEQTFNKLKAYTVAIHLARTDTALYPAPVADTGEEAPDAPAEALMPWLQLNHANRIHRQQLQRLLDTVYANKKIGDCLSLLKSMQRSDGSVSWFPGGNGDLYISCYLLAGFGQLLQEQLLPSNIAYQPLLSGLVRYCDSAMHDANSKGYELEYLYARTYWLKQFPFSSMNLVRADSLFAYHFKRAHQYSIGRTGMLIAAALRYGGEPHSREALTLLESVRQRAISDSNGTRWKELSDPDDLNSGTEEGMVKIAEAFEASQQIHTVVDGIVQWLLLAKADHRWSTTKATADAVGLLYRHQQVLSSAPLQLQAIYPDGHSQQVTDHLSSGQLYAFDSIAAGKPFPAHIVVQKQGAAATGGLQYYYFTATPPATAAAAGVSLIRTLERWNAVAGAWERIMENTVLHAADKVRATLTIHAPRLLQYVLIEDKRAATLEPADITSGYRYGNGISWYQSVRDAGMQFFATKIPAGTSSVAYEMVVNGEGTFTYAPAILQCMYQPEAKAYSSSIMIEVQ